MKPEFNRSYSNQLNPRVNVSQDFDWSTLSDRLGEEKEHYAGDAKDLEVLGKVLNLLLGDADGEKINVKRVGLNVIGLGWVLNPGLFDGSPSVRTLARRCGVSAAALADATGRISRLIGWRNRAQSHAWNWRSGQNSTKPKKGGP